VTATVSNPSVAIIGGGLSGLATAVVLCERGLRVELFEARRELGGRAGSFRDSVTEKVVDHCQHVGMFCCTNLTDFFRRTEVDGLVKRFDVLHFFGTDGKRVDFRATAWLPAPLHLGPSLFKFGFLSWPERLSIAKTIMRLARTPKSDTAENPTIGQWLRKQKQSTRAIQQFWSIVLVSALGESIDRASLAAARKVFVDGFMTHRMAYQIDLPTVSLGELYGERVARWLKDRGVTLHVGTPVKQLKADGGAITGLSLSDGSKHEADLFVVALPWRRVSEVLPDIVTKSIAELRTVNQIKSAPITGIHLWLDRPITTLPHAVLIDRLSQWMFNRGKMPATSGTHQSTFYYQVVISASRELAGRDRNDILKEVIEDLSAIWPQAREAKVAHWRMVTEHDAVFSFVPGFEELRPSQQTPFCNLFLAGDWTRTGWPSTMEGAVKSGYLAAEYVLKAIGRKEAIVQPELPRNWLTRFLIGS